ncbi:hypothetical protein [Geodermatophilus sp. DF01-2]|uniref:hypothetical protein n=1 Tax=Geodermatophilus sp. DF01-2 TaxID=2559610 RepID=UPI001FD82E46|nr:hypothetical protein [Geodermatophilus sp. DF01_2]
MTDRNDLPQPAHRNEHGVLLDPPDQVRPGGRRGAPQLVAGKVPVGQQQHARPQPGQHPTGQHLLTGGVEAVEGRGQRRVGAALDQRQQPQLRMTGVPGAAGGLDVGRGVGDIEAGAVEGHHPAAEGEHPQGCDRGQRPAQAGEQRLQRPGAQPSAGPGRRRPGRQPQPTQLAQPGGLRPQHAAVARRAGGIGGAVQAQREHEVHHRPRRQQPAPPLHPPGRGHHLIDQLRPNVLGQHSQPQRQPLLRRQRRGQAATVIAAGG